MPIIEQLYELSPEDSTVLFSNNDLDQAIEVRQYKSLRWLQIDGSLLQSVMSVEHPEDLLNPINQAMCTALIYPKKLDRLLNIGLGGGSFERCFQSKLPSLEMEAIESNEIVIHLAREYFHIAYEYPVYLQKADSFLQQCDSNYDIVLCDIFDDEYHPDCLYQTEFYRDMANSLSQQGSLALNLTPNNEEDLLQILLPLRQSFPYVRLLEIDNHSNIAVLACKETTQDKSELLHRSQELSQQLGFDLTHFYHQLIDLPKSPSPSP